MLKGNTEDEIVIKTADKINLAQLLATVAAGQTATFAGNLTTESK